MCKDKAEELNRMTASTSENDANEGDAWTANDVQWAIWTAWQLGAATVNADMN